MSIDLSAAPPRILRLPRDRRGYPIPRFVKVIDGVPDFRITDRSHWMRCVLRHLCWVCGDPLGRHAAFVCGPSTAMTRTSTEPPSHLDCARGALQICPYIMHPRRGRDERGLEDHVPVPGIAAIDRNPGVWLLWVTDHYEARRTQAPIIDMGSPSLIEWWTIGRRATPDEAKFVVDRAVGELAKFNPRTDLSKLRQDAEVLISTEEK